MSITSDWGSRVDSSQLSVSLKKVWTYVKPRGHISEFAPPVPKTILPIAKPEQKKPAASISKIDLSKTYTFDEMLQELIRIKPPETVIVNAKKITIKKSEFTEDEVKALHALSIKHDGPLIWFM